MQAELVLALWTLFEENDLKVCLDGGWAVDAALGQQTRPHGDLDIALPASRVPALRQLLSGLGFDEIPQANSSAHNFVLQDRDGAQLDVHSYELNTDGSNRSGIAYIADHLSGEGWILGHRVRCVPPDWLVRFHAGYDLDDNDWHDVRLLCERFAIQVPDDFIPFLDRHSEE